MRLGSRIGGSARLEGVWAYTQQEYIVPSYPGDGCGDWCVARKPAAPLLSQQSGHLLNAYLAARMYRKVMLCHTTSCKHFSEFTFGASTAEFTGIVRSEHFPTLSEAVPVLIDLRIAPHAWVAFSLEVWTRYVRARNKRMPEAPPPKWVFSLKRITDRLEWFSWHENFVAGQEVEICQEHKALVRAHTKMKRAIIALGRSALIPATSAAAQQIAVHASEYSRVYVELAAVIGTTYKAQESTWARLMRSGEWIW